MKTYKEDHDSQAPALNLLRKLGWQYISPEQTITDRGGIMSNVIIGKCEIDSVLQKLLIRDWQRNEDVQKQMKNEVEDYLLAKRGDFGVEISLTF